MKKLIAATIFFFSCFLLSAQYPQIAWAKALIPPWNSTSGYSDNVWLNKVALDDGGNLFVLGNFEDSISPDHNNPAIVIYGDLYTPFIAKYDLNGNYLWLKTIEGVDLMDITVDHYGNILICGKYYYTNTVDFDLGPGTANITTAGPGGAFFFAKYDSNGNYLMAKILPGPSSTTNSGMLSAIRTDSSSNIYLGGRISSSSVDMDPGPGTSTIGCFSCNAGFYAKYDSIGNLLWSRRDVDNSGVTSLELHYPSGNIVVGSESGHIFRYVLANGTCTDSVYSYSNTVVRDITTDVSGNIYFAGTYTYTAADLNWESGSTSLPATSTGAISRYFIAKYDVNKTFQWARSYELDSVNGLANTFEVNVLSDGNILASFNMSSGGFFASGICKLYNLSTETPIWNSRQSTAQFPGSYLWVFRTLYHKATESIFLYGTLGSGVSNPTYIFSPDMNGSTSQIVTNKMFGFMVRYANCSNAPSIPSSISGLTTLCSNAPQTYSVAAAPGITAYNWVLPAGWSGTSTTNSITVTPSANGGTIYVTAQNTCGASTPRTLSVTYGSPPTVTANTTSQSLCAGNPVTLTGGGASTYSWSNGVSNGIAFTPLSTQTYTVTGSQGTCSATASVTVVVNPPVVPAVSIVSNAGNSICAGTNVTFTATPTNGGTSPTYQWKINGTNVGTNAATYTTNTLANNDVIACVMTSNADCASPGTVSSNSITMNVSSYVTPVVGISANTGSSICSGTSVTFTATPTNGGANPIFQWKLNGNNVGTNAATYTTNTLANNDVVECALTSNASCASPTSATSNSIVLSVSSIVVPAVSISSNTGNSICSGTSVTFTATPTNSGNSPAYQWKLNGNNVGTNAATYTTTTLANNDVVECILTSNASCPTSANATSNTISMTVDPVLSPSISINASQTNTCSGTAVTFTALTLNAGSAPTYQWSINGIAVGGNSDTYTSNLLTSTDTVICILTSSETCVTSSVVMSGGATVNVSELVNASISIVADTTSVCDGQPVAFQAIPVNGGSLPLYQWFRNNAPINGATAATYTELSPAANDMFKCEMTSNADCVSLPDVFSNDIQITVNNLPDVTVIQTNNVLSVAPANSYQWYNCDDNTSINGATDASYLPTGNGSYKVIVSNSNGCLDTSECVNVAGVAIEEVAFAAIALYPNPNYGLAYLQIPQALLPCSIKLTNALGETLAQFADSGITNLSIQIPWAAGIYILSVTNSNGSRSIRILKTINQ